MEAACPYETVITTYQTVKYHILDLSVNFHFRDNYYVQISYS
jgi:hypothetical protein